MNYREMHLQVTKWQHQVLSFNLWIDIQCVEQMWKLRHPGLVIWVFDFVKILDEAQMSLSMKNERLIY